MRKVDDGNQIIDLKYDFKEGHISVSWEYEYGGTRMTSKSSINAHNIPDKVDEEALRKAANNLLEAIHQV